MDLGTRALRIVATQAGDQLLDLACRACGACLAGVPVCCQSPREQGDLVADSIPERSVGSVVNAGYILDAILHAVQGVRTGIDTSVLLLGDDMGHVHRALEREGFTNTFLADDRFDVSVRDQLAQLHGTGRARIVATMGDSREAVKAVRRGGTICVPPGRRHSASVTELVQREVTVETGGDPARGLRLLAKVTEPTMNTPQ